MIVHLFEWDTYYPAGGWNDHVGTFDRPHAMLVALNRNVTHDDRSPATHAQVVVDGQVHSLWERRVEYAGSPPTGDDGCPRWSARPDEWIYPTDDFGTIRWHVSAWELDDG